MNRLLLSGLAIVFFIVIGCSTKDEAPGDVLPKEKMEAVLWDILQAERFTATFVARDSSKNITTENFKLYNQIFAIHQVDKDQFIKSYKFYLSRPDISRVLFDSLSSKATRKREEMYKVPIVDSAAKAADSARQPVKKDTPAVQPKPKLLQPLPVVKKAADTVKTKPTPKVVRPDTARVKSRYDSTSNKAVFRQRKLLRNKLILRDSLKKQ